MLCKWLYQIRTRGPQQTPPISGEISMRVREWAGIR